MAMFYQQIIKYHDIKGIWDVKTSLAVSAVAQRLMICQSLQKTLPLSRLSWNAILSSLTECSLLPASYEKQIGELQWKNGWDISSLKADPIRDL